MTESAPSGPARHDASAATVIWRGVRRRCGRCGERKIFDGWFQPKDRCPSCGYQFAREEGFFIGVYTVNFVVTEGFILLGLIAFVVWRGVVHAELPLLPFVVATCAAAIVAPVAFYPFAVTIWAAIDLATRPLDPVEEAEAVVHEAEAEPGEGESDADAEEGSGGNDSST